MSEENGFELLFGKCAYSYSGLKKKRIKEQAAVGKKMESNLNKKQLLS